MAAYIRTPNNTLARAVALTVWGSNILVPQWDMPTAWSFATGATGLSSTAVSGVSGFGYAAAATDAASGAWLLQYNGGIANYASGGAISNFALPAGRIFTGASYSAGQNSIYAVDSSGTIYTPSGTGAVQVAGGFGSVPAWGLAASGNTLYTMQATVSGIGTFTLSASASGASGLIGTVFSNPSCLTAASGRFGVGGWSNASLATGFNSLAVDPVQQTTMLGVNSTSTALLLIVDQGGQNWATTQTLSGMGNVSRAAWFPNGLGALVTDNVSGRVIAVSYSAGTISSGQSLPVSGISRIAVLPGSVNAFVAQQSLNEVTPLFSSGGVWASGAPVAINSPNGIFALSPTSVAVGFASGVAIVSGSALSWSVASSAALTYLPRSFALDASGNLYCSGPSGASGLITIFQGTQTVSAQVSYVGGNQGLVLRQNQIVVGDNTNNLLRVFGLASGTLAFQQISTIGAPFGVNSADDLPIGVQTIFAAGSGGTSEYFFLSPFTLDYQRNGMVSIYVSGVANTANLGVGHQPSALAFDPSGNLSVVTVQNDLYSISATGGVISSGAVPQFSPQPQTTPLGLSYMQWINGHLYAVSSEAGILVQVI